MGFDNRVLASNIRAWRARADMTQGALASEIGMNASTVVKYEDGSMVPGSDKLYAIASALHCTPNDLMGWRGEHAAG